MKANKNSTPIRTVLIYALFGVLWILITDLTVDLNSPSVPTLYHIAQSVKGVFFVLASALLIYVILLREVRALQESEERYRLLFDASLDAVLLTTPDGLIQAANPAACRMFGRTEEEIKQVGRAGLADLTDARLQSAIEERVRTGYFFGELTLLRSDGTKFPGEVSTSVFKDRRGRQQTSMIIRDITSRKHAEEAIRESEERFSSIFYASPFAMNLFRLADNAAVIANDAFISLTGYSRGELVGHTAAELNLFVDPNQRNAWMKELKETGSTKPQDIQIRKKSGEIREASAAIEIIEIGGEKMGLVMALDITERKRAEEAFKENEERLELVLEGSQLGFWDWNIETGEVHRNAQWAEMLGYTLSEVEFTVRQWTDLHHPHDRERAMQSIQDHLDGKTPVHRVEYRMKTKDGSYKWILDQARIVKRDADGKPLRMSGTHIDITDRHIVEAALRFTQFAVDHLGDVVLWMNSSGRFIYVNDAACRLLGYSREELLTMSVPDIDPLYPKERWRENWDALCQHKHQVLESRHQAKDGHTFPVEITDNLIEINGQMFNCAIIRDITERKMAEAALRESNARYELVLEGAGVGIWDWDIPNRRVHFTARWKQMRGYAENDISDSETEWSDNIHPEDAPRVRTAVREHFEGLTEFFEEEYRVWHKDGSYLWILDRGKAVRDADGQVVRMAGSEIDITSRKQAEEKLRASESMMSASQRIGHVGSWVLDLASNQLTWSDEVYRIFGIEPQAFGATYEAFLDRIHPDDRSAVDAAYTASLRERRDTYEIEHRIVRLDTGEVRHVHERGRHEYDEAGAVLRSVGMVQDITERKQAEEKLRESEARYRALLESTSDSVYVLDREWRHIVVNEAATRFVQMPRAKLLGNKLTDLFPGVEETMFFETFQRVMETRESDTTVAMYTFPDGKKGWYEVRVDPTPEGILCISRDITERKQAEDELHVALVKYKALFDCFPLGITVSNEAGNILEANSMAGSLLSVTKEEHMRRNIDGAEWKIVRPDGTPMPPDEFASVKALKEKRVIENVEMGVIKADNSIMWISVNAAPLPVEGYGVVVTYGDITERKQAEEEIRQLNATLERRVEERTAELLHANRAKDDFLANMSHELRTPLNGILGFAEMLQQGMHGPISEKQAQDLEIIYSSGQHLLGLITDILDIAKIEAGNFDLHSEVVPLNSVCQSSLVFIKQLAQKKSISVEYSPAAPAATIFADPKRLKQILVNLLNNAVKFTPEHGNIKLEVWEDLEASQVRFSVTDTGIGIAPEDLQKLFKPFVQLDSSLSRQHEGAGLGLSLVKKLVELHGGSIEVESELGRGSCFRVSIPIGLENMPVKAAPGIVSQDDMGKTAIPVQEAGNKRILVTEDNPINRMVMSDFLASKGHEVIEAENGMEAIEKARVNKPAVILMDIQMPVMNGFETIKRLREIPEFSSIPIVALTALAMPGDRESCLEAGADEYLSKPVSLKKLAELIETLLQKGAHA